MKYVKSFWSGVKEGSAPVYDAAWWGKNVVGATFYVAGAGFLGLNNWQFIGVLCIISAVNIWREG
jgi:hypothetical protein